MKIEQVDTIIRDFGVTRVLERMILHTDNLVKLNQSDAEMSQYFDSQRRILRETFNTLMGLAEKL